MRDVTQAEADDYLVIVISDANIDRYGVSPEELTKSTPSLTLFSLSLSLSLQRDIIPPASCCLWTQF